MNGVDFDMEPASGFADGYVFFQNQIIALVTKIRAKLTAKNGIPVVKWSNGTSKPFIVMYTILMGSPNTWSTLVHSNTMDYLSLMLYNGGMYRISSGNAAGCNWDDWARTVLSKCADVHCNPMNSSPSAYCQTCDWQSDQFTCASVLKEVEPSKVLLGLITDSFGNPATVSDVNSAMDLTKHYGGGGIIMWVFANWQTQNSKNLVGCTYAKQVCDDPYFGCSPATPCPIGQGGGGGGDAGAGLECTGGRKCATGSKCIYYATNPTTVHGPDGTTCTYGPKADVGCCVKL
jgi:hypothetical protein